MTLEGAPHNFQGAPEQKAKDAAFAFLAEHLKAGAIGRLTFRLPD
jgi:hypothetical protein